MEERSANNDYLVVSYLALRKAIGLLGVSYPLVLSLGAMLIFHTPIQRSISAYHHTGLRDVFAGTLWAIGVFLLSYKGYGRADDIAGNLGCIFAVGVTLFPTLPLVGVASTNEIWFGHLHQAFAAAFFLTLIYFSLFLFTKTHPGGTPTQRKLQRNLIYKVCGYTMAVCILLIVIYYRLTGSAASLFQPYNPVLWLESIAIVAFGFSWLTKGEAILKDLKPENGP